MATHLHRVETDDSLDGEPAAHTGRLRPVVRLERPNAHHPRRITLSMELPNVDVAGILRADELRVLSLLHAGRQKLDSSLVPTA